MHDNSNEILTVQCIGWVSMERTLKQLHSTESWSRRRRVPQKKPKEKILYLCIHTIFPKLDTTREIASLLFSPRSFLPQEGPRKMQYLH